MRWRGYDLTAYTDAEIVAVSDRLGGGVSETGETTEASREALAQALRQMRASGGVVERPPRAEQEASPADEAPAPPRAVEDEPVPVSPPTPEARPTPAREPLRVPRAPAPGGPDDRSLLVRFRHVFGIHSWQPAAGPEGIHLRCPGCRQERPLAPGPQPLMFEREELEDQPRAETPAEPEDRPEPTVEDEWRIPPPPDGAPGQPRHQPDTMPALLGWLLRSPWWVKMLAVFALVQIAGVIASVVRSV